MSNYQESCIFCRIIKGKVPAVKIYEDEHVFAMLDIRPASPKGGHVLVMPKEHYELLTEIPDNVMIHISQALKKVGKALLKFSDGFNILQNNKEAAGQAVSHVHFHLVPRYRGDGVTIERWQANRYESQQKMDAVAEKIKNLIPNL